MEHRGPLPDVAIPDVTLYDYLFADIATEDLDRPAVIHDTTGQCLSYAELRAHIDAIAAWCAGQGVGPGAVVAVHLPNSPEYMSGFHGVARAGGAVTPLNVAYTTPELVRQLTLASAVKVITHEATLETAAEAAALIGLAPDDVIVVLSPSSADQPDEDSVARVRDAGHTPYDDLLATEGPPPEVHIEPATHVACLPFSSGKGGLPKAVQLTHRNLVANVAQYVPVLDAKYHVLVAFLPFSHVYALTASMNYGLLTRSLTLTMARFDPRTFMRLVEKHRATLLYIVPPVAALLATHPKVDEYDLTSVEVVISGAAPLDREIGDRVALRLNCEMLQGFGMTELSPITHVKQLNMPDVDVASIGPAMPNIRFRVVDVATGQDVDVPETGQSAPGEMWCTGPNVMLGYLGNPTDGEGVLDADGWIHTGDLVTVDAQSIVTVVGRCKELIKARGFQVPPVEVEAVLSDHPDVDDVAVVGLVVPNSQGDEAAHALVVLRPGASLELADLRAHVTGRLASYKHPRSLTLVETIPRDELGRIRRSELAALVRV